MLVERLQPILDKVWTVCTSKGVTGRTVTLKVKFSDFEQITRARSILVPVDSRETLAQISLGLLRDVFPLRRSVRLIGVSLSGLQHGAGEAPRQLGLALEAGA